MAESPLKQLSKLTDIAAGTAGLIKKNRGQNAHQRKQSDRANLIKLLRGAGVKADVPEDPSQLDATAIIDEAIATIPATMLGLAGDKIDQPELVKSTVEKLVPTLTAAVRDAVDKKSVNIHSITETVVEMVDGAQPGSDVAAAFNIMNNAFAMVGGPHIDEDTTIEGGADDNV